MKIEEGQYTRTRLGIGRIIKVGRDNVTIDFSNPHLGTMILPISDTNIKKSKS